MWIMYVLWVYLVTLGSPVPAEAGIVNDAVDLCSPQNCKCILPEYPANGKYISDITSAKPGDVFDLVTINITCGQGFEVDGYNSVRCRDGSWTEKIPKCIEECGTVPTAGTTLIIDGVHAKHAEVPWHAGIYTRTTRPYKQICGGSLIRNNIVISAAHCFWSDIEGKLPAADYAVALGKVYRPWIDTREEAQQSDVKELHLTDHFQGSAANFQDDIAVVIVTDPFVYTAHIRPVCVDFDFVFQESQLIPRHKADTSTRKTRGRILDRNVVETFVDPAASPPAPFQHLTVDRNTGRVYIGALNRIHQLTPDLKRTQWIVTGPVMNSNECLDLTDVCLANFPLELTDNANKVLVVDHVNSMLVTCGSVLHGMCSVRNLSNISLDVREVREQIAGNDDVSSTVAFIAPGPPHPLTTDVLYVGTSYSGIIGNNLVRMSYVLSRSLEDDQLFKITSTKEDTDSYMENILLQRYKYPTYVYGFSSEGFSYFLTTQLLKFDLDMYYSKLVRVCQDDKHYYSYTEIPISCTGVTGGKYMTYNLVQAAFVGKAGPILSAELGISTQQDVLFATFSQSVLIYRNQPSNQSALCVYSLKAIRRTFTNNIKRCFGGIGSRWTGGLNISNVGSKWMDGLNVTTNSDSLNGCVAMELPIDEDFCGNELNSFLFGELPIMIMPAAVFDTRLTAVAATTTGDHTVVFAGTADGFLKKILVDNSSSAFEYGGIDIGEGSPINKDLIFDTQFTHLYVMTESRISKVRVQECNEYKSCQACLEAIEPYCGWSLLENECNLLPDGRNATKDPPRWISYRSRCPTIIEVIPNQLQRTILMTLIILIENLTTYKGQFACAFTAFGHTVVTNATRTSSGVSCDTPHTDTLPSVPDSQHHFTARLSVHTAQGSDVVATEFKFFDCNTYSSCTQCVTSPFPCDWCLDGNRCTHNFVEHCRNDILVTSVNKTDSNTSIYHTDSFFCPAINSTGTNEISLYIYLVIYCIIYTRTDISNNVNV